MTTKATILGIEKNGRYYSFKWGPNTYAVKCNLAGNYVWKRWNERRGFWRRVDLVNQSDTAFYDRMMECVNCLMLEG